MNWEKNYKMGNTSRKAIFFDIDGTISSEETGLIPESAVRAIRKANENGHLTFINSGRTLSSIEEKYKAIGFHGYICGCGTAIYEGEACVYKSVLSREVCFYVMEKARETKVTAVYESEEDICFDPMLPKHPVVEGLANSIQFKKTTALPENLNEADYLFEKFCIWLTDEADFDSFKEALEDSFEFIDRGAGMYEIPPKGISKASGIQKVMELYEIPLEDCYAIGDSTNDLQMLQFVPNSIAMGKCSKEILPHCIYQTDCVENDGLEKALKHFEII